MSGPTSEQVDDAVAAIALALDESIAEFVEIRASDYGFEADARKAARIAVATLIDSGWSPS